MGGKHVEGPLKPVSTATSDEEVGQTTNPESGPCPEIHALVNLWFTILLHAPEVFFEIGGSVLHEEIHLPEIWHAVCKLT